MDFHNRLYNLKKQSFFNNLVIERGIEKESLRVNKDGFISLTVKGDPFGGLATYSESFLIRPNNNVVEEFFEGLDDLESILLNRESKVKYTAKFRAPEDSSDGSKTELKTNQISWPLYRDKWNLKISGSAYISYVEELSTLGERIDNYK